MIDTRGYFSNKMTIRMEYKSELYFLYGLRYVSDFDNILPSRPMQNCKTHKGNLTFLLHSLQCSLTPPTALAVTCYLGI